MAKTTTELQTLDINFLSEEQYQALVDAGTVDEDALYMTPSSGSSSATSYNELTDKPSINGVTLTGNKTAADLGINSAAWGNITGTLSSQTDLNTALNSKIEGVSITKSTDTVIGSNSTFSITQPTVSLSTGATAGTGVVSVATGITSSSATGGGVSFGTKEEVEALTGLGTATTSGVIGTDSTFTITQPSITLSSNAESATGRVQVATNATATTSKLETTTITGVSGSVIASKAVPATNQTTATGVGSASTTNTDWLKGVTVTGETLVIGAATMDTQTTSQYTFSDITVPKAASSTTVATGSLTSSGSGAEVATGVTSSKTYLGAQASGANTTWNNKNIVNAVTGYSSPVTSTVLGSETTLSYTNPTITVTPTTTNIKATASGANTSWNNKDQVTVLTDSTDIVINH